MKQSDSVEELEEEDNCLVTFSDMKLEKYGFGLKLKISGFVSFLAWTGMIGGVLGILASVSCLIYLPGSVLHSHWSRNVEARLSLVESFIVASSLMP